MRAFFCGPVLVLFLFSCADQREQEAVQFFQKANFASRQGDFREAIRLYTEAIEKKADLVDAYNNRGLAYRQVGESDRALRDFDQATKLRAAYWEAWYNRSQVLADGGRWRESLADLERLPPTYRDSAYVLVALGNARMQLNNRAGALADYDRALRLDPRNAEAFVNRGALFFAEKQPDRAEADFKQALQLDPNQHFALNNLSLIEAGRENYREALQLVDRAVMLKPGQAAYLNNRGFYLLQTAQLGAGLQSVESSIRLDDANAWAWRNRGIYFLKTNNFRQALLDLRKAEQLDPGVDALYFYLGEALRLSQQKTEACKAYRRGQQLGESLATRQLNRFCP